MTARGGTERRVRRLLVANRGEIALRVIRTAHEMDIETVAVFSDADRTALHVRAAHRAQRLGPPPPSASYLDVLRVLEAARKSGADAVHPGYGFLAESARFAQAVQEAGLVFVGPPPEAMRAMGDKLSARRTVTASGVPVVPGATLPADLAPEAVAKAAREVGFPLLVKAAFGGGGKGMRLASGPDEVAQAVRRAAAEAEGAFGDGTVYLERVIEGPRHVEVQVLCDGQGNALALGERECSVQRRHQKVIEESPSPAVDPELRARMEEAAVATARACGYESAGTVEFLLGADGAFHFLEMNTRIQVEHPLTEMRFGVDLVREQIRVARGEAISFAAHRPGPRGHAVEARICAEDADRGFLPSTGRIDAVQLPGGPGIRVDAHVYPGQEITLHYDNLLGKVVAWAEDREGAIRRLRRALHETRIGGVTTNVPFLLRVLDDPGFAAGTYDTSIAERVPAPAGGEEGDLVPVVAAAVAAHRRLRPTPMPAPAARPARSPWRWGPDGWA